MKQTERGVLGQIGWQFGVLMAVLLFLHGCAAQQSVVSSTTQAPSQAPPTTQPPTESASRESVPVAKEGKAAGALLASARDNVRGGKYNQAEMMLERALRLEPRNARLWHEMAQVKYGQKDYKQVVQFCIKSKGLAGKDYDLIRKNWLLMEKAYRQLGETEKAGQARSKAR